MKYDRKNLETHNDSQTATEAGSNERVYLGAGAAACLFATLYDVFNSDNFVTTVGVAIGVVIAALNYRLWKIIVTNLIADAVRRSTAEEKTHSPALIFLLSTKLVALVFIFAIVFKSNGALVVPTLMGVTAYVLGGTLLILLISYNKR